LYSRAWTVWSDVTLLGLSLEGFDLPSLTARERLEVTFRLIRSPYGHGRNPDLGGDFLTMMRGWSLTLYRLTGFDGNRAEFELAGRRQPTPLEKLTYWTDRYAGDVVARKAMAYVWTKWGRRITAFDLQNPQHPRRAGHFLLAGDTISGIAPLEGNRLLVAGERQLYVVRLPGAD
jgi:hypothetical protein